jgi:hypothetical protein
LLIDMNALACWPVGPKKIDMNASLLAGTWFILQHQCWPPWKAFDLQVIQSKQVAENIRIHTFCKATHSSLRTGCSPSQPRGWVSFASWMKKAFRLLMRITSRGIETRLIDERFANVMGECVI